RDAEQLQQVILKNISQRARALVVLAAAFDADVFRHRDLDVVDIATIPDRLKDAVGKTENQDVLDRLLPQVVVDPVDLRLGENRVDRVIQLFGGFQVVTEGLLDDDPLPSCSGAGDARRAQTFHDDGEELRRGGEVEDAV